MTIELWDWLEHLNLLVGADFPAADEDALRRCRHAWTDAAAGLRALTPDAAKAGASVVGALGGAAGEAFTDVWHPFTAHNGYLEQLGTLFEQLGAACEQTALDVEYAKLEYIGALVALGVTLASLTAALVAGGVSALGMPVAIAATQFTIRLLITRLIASILAGAVFNVGLDVAAQLVQFADGHRKEWDSSKTEKAALDGAIFGGIGGGAFLGAGRMMSPAMGRVAAALGLLGAAGAGGVIGGVVVPLVHGEATSVEAVVTAAAAGTIGGLGALHGHGHGATEHLSTVDIPRLDALGPTGIARAVESGIDVGHLPTESGPLGSDAYAAYRDGDGRAQPGDAAPSRVDTVVLDSLDSLDSLDTGRAAQDPTLSIVDAGRPGDHEFTNEPANDDRVTPSARRADPGVFADPERSADSGLLTPSAGHVGAAAPMAGHDFVRSATPERMAARPVVDEVGGQEGLTLPSLDRSGTANPPSHIRDLVGSPSPADSDRRLQVAQDQFGPSAEVSYMSTLSPSPLDGFGSLASATPQPPERAWASRGAIDPFTVDLAERWQYEEESNLSLSGLESFAVDRYLDRARAAEPTITPIVAAVAVDVAGTLIDTHRVKGPDSLKAKIASAMVRVEDPRTFAEALADTKDGLRYSIVLDEDGYSDRTRQAIAGLVDRGLRPVSESQKWGNAKGYRGLNTAWFHEGTGQVFEVQFHTPASFHAKTASHPFFGSTRYASDSPEAAARRERHDAFFVDVTVPSGATEVGLPPSLPLHVPSVKLPDLPRSRSAADPTQWDPTQWDEGQWDEGQWYPSRSDRDPEWIDSARTGPLGMGPFVDPRRLVTDGEAITLGRSHVVPTEAGFAFYPVEDSTWAFAAAVRPTNGYVTLDLHGSARGFQIDQGLLTPQQFAAVIRDLRVAGVISIPEGMGLRLISCDTAFGANTSPAAILARELGIEVLAPDQPVWTNTDGLELVSSPVLVDGMLTPRIPPDGQWRRFSPAGHEIP